jgi:hypothetical protein
VATRLLPRMRHGPPRLDLSRGPLRAPDGRLYTAHACGRQREDGAWDAWLEFVAVDGSRVVSTERETTQPTLAELVDWASETRWAYLRAALERAVTSSAALDRTVTRPAILFEPPLTEPVSDEPAPPAASRTRSETSVRPPVPNPFAVYAQGEGVLREQLAAMPHWHLRALIIAYDFADPSDVDLEALTTSELIELIIRAVRARLAA